MVGSGELLAHGKPIGIGECDVEQHDLRIQGLSRLHGRRAISRLADDVVAF
jgi:hypothetical protein